MHSEDIPKTAITTPFGTFSFNYSCNGLLNSDAISQRMIDGIFGDLPICCCYIDGILVFSSIKEEHLRHLSKVMGRLQQDWLVVRNKCVLGAREVDFLGHHLSPAGVSSLPDKVTTIQGFLTPTSVKALQEFMGMVNIYHCFLPGIASTMAHLYPRLAGKHKDLTWGPSQVDALQKAKDALAGAAHLAFAAPG